MFGEPAFVHNIAQHLPNIAQHCTTFAQHCTTLHNIARVFSPFIPQLFPNRVHTFVYIVNIPHFEGTAIINFYFIFYFILFLFILFYYKYIYWNTAILHNITQHLHNIAQHCTTFVILCRLIQVNQWPEALNILELVFTPIIPQLYPNRVHTFVYIVNIPHF